ncbi:MAG TPA: CoA transferase [Caulobacteraceae bacterium]|nr:CoA transferase [Caulobacteraceae bacterium]
MSGEALQGLRLLEIGDSLPVAWCGRQFALWGADVVVVEGPAGSPQRRSAPRVGGELLTWQYVAAGKRAVAATPEELFGLASRADVLLLDDPAGVAARMGRSLEDLRRAAPDLTVVAISSLGADGPFAGWAASDLTVQALAGYLSLNGRADRPPLRAPGHVLAYACGVNAFIAALASLVGRLDGGRGQRVEVSELETIAAILPFLRVELTGAAPRREGGPGTGVRVFPCRDGYVSFMPPTPAQRPAYGAVLGIAEVEWPAVDEGGSRVEKRDQLLAVLDGRTADKTVEAVFLGFLGRGIVCGRIASPRDLLVDEHLAARGFFQRMEDPTLGVLALPGAPACLSRTPAAPPTPAPGNPVGAEALGWSRPGVLPGGGGAPRRPLAGVRVLDATQAWIGPFAAMLLADLRAEVIKVESHKRPDVWRQWSANPIPLTHVRAEEVNASPNYNSVNRNKRGLTLDLKQEAGKALFRRLAERADVLMENYTPRVMERFGLGAEALAELNPRLVTSSFCGFGKTGPLADYKANGASIEGVAGWDYLHRHPGDPPVVMGFYQADAISGLQMAAVTLVALVHQRRTGEGQAIDGSMMEAAAGYIGERLLAAQVGDEPGPTGNRDPDQAPSGVYASAGDDRWVAVRVPDDAAWARLASIIPGLDDPVLTAREARIERHDAIDAVISAWTSSMSPEAAAAQLQGAGVPAAAVRSLSEALACPHLASWFRPNVHEDTGTQRYNGFAWRFVGVEAPHDLPPPRLGEHSRAILGGELGLSGQEIDALMARGVTGEVLAKVDTAVDA